MKCTTLDDVKRDLIRRGGERTNLEYQNWRSSSDRIDAGVVDYVENEKHTFIYEVTHEEFNAVSQLDFGKDAPLLDIHPNKHEGVYKNPDDARSVKLAADLGTGAPWSVMQVFHKFLEAERTIPDWPTFKDLVYRREAERIVGAYRLEFWFEYVDCLRSRRDFQSLLLGSTTTLESMLEIGLRWRLANIYFSALRELELVILLRERFSLDVNYHVLADTVFKADLWATVGDQVRAVAIYIRGEQLGRKKPLARILTPPEFATREIEIEREQVQFAYWPIRKESLQKVADFFKVP